jgi:hypothetical protein
MTEIAQMMERRLLAALAQAAASRLPEPVASLRPGAPRLRAAAALLLETAQEPSRPAMVEGLRRIARRIRDRRQERPGGEALLLEKLATYLEGLGTVRDPGPGTLLRLGLWRELDPRLARELEANLAGLERFATGPSEAWLDEAARVLLRAMARSWEDEARLEDREGGSGREVAGAPGGAP